MTILESARRKAEQGERLSLADALALYEENDLLFLADAARRAKERASSRSVFFNVNRHINLTNICTSGCPLCAFQVADGDSHGYVMEEADVARVLAEAKEVKRLGEIHIVSALHPTKPFDYYINVVRQVKAALPDADIKAFTPVEIVHFAEMTGKSVKEVLALLQEAGLSSLPGGGAEILVDRIRKRIAPKKIMTDDWLRIMKTAHTIGMESTATMVIGFGETMADRIEHMEKVRRLQDETGGFRAFITWTFQPRHTELGGEKASSWDYLTTLALTRLYLDNIAHIQGSWVTQGERIGQLTLGFGADDLGSIMLEENVVKAAGTRYEMSIQKMVRLIQGAGREAAQRDTEYRVLKTFSERSE